MTTHPVIIFGAGRLAQITVDIFLKNKIDIYGILDDNKQLHNKDINEIPILGSTNNDEFLNLLGKTCDAVVADDDSQIRTQLVSELIKERKIMPINAIDMTTNIALSASLGYGNLIMGQVSILPKVQIGYHTIIHNGVSIGTESIVKDCVSIGQHASIGAEVTIEEGAFIGNGAILIDGVTIGKKARIGAGSVVIAHVKNGEQVFGNPAKKI